MGCPDIPMIHFGEFGEKLAERAKHKRIPLLGMIELTYRCNLRCVHSYVDGISTQPSELGSRELFALMDEFAEEGCMSLLLTGGEPLARRDFREIHKYGKKMGMQMHLFTNATLVDEQMADFLAEWPPRSIEVSLYGATERTYEMITGVEGSFHQASAGVEHLAGIKVPIRLKTMLMTLNRHELGRMRTYADKLGLPFRFDPGLFPTIAGSRRPVDLALTPDEVVALDVADEERIAAWQDVCSRMLRPPSQPERLYTCGVGRRSFWVDPYGRMALCALSRRPNYDLIRGSFREAWQKALPEVLAEKRKNQIPCSTCDLHGICIQCPGYSEVWSGNREEPVEAKCILAHRRNSEIFGKWVDPDELTVHKL